MQQCALISMGFEELQFSKAAHDHAVSFGDRQ